MSTDQRKFFLLGMSAGILAYWVAGVIDALSRPKCKILYYPVERIRENISEAFDFPTKSPIPEQSVDPVQS